ncbi:TetR family transcriptional regulator C-terminal domain-containing protein [Pikeienuella piscinae]|uniref:TetR family transcriptional regulator C-terminal domain-containing protein n=1 Tax=Pikeienuella piscinae TaxID=2748098 RepID=UPI001FE9E662|nr:TetR family transcriptional regulator C-terminal domain-containing protein [Pikeienuella piscinae]
MPNPRRTRIQTENRLRIVAAAIDIFAQDGFRGATVDAIAERAGMSKPNLLYYFPSKEAIYREVLERLLDDWLAPLRALDETGDPAAEIAAYLDRKIEMARDFPAESRLFANEMLRGAPNLSDVLAGELKALVDEKAEVIRAWIRQGRIRPIDPYHLIFAIWATTQHYADFDPQVRAVLGDDGEGRFHDGAAFLRTLFLDGLRPR